MEEDLLNPEVIMRILTETSKSEDKDRRIQSFDAYQVYSGNQRTYVEKFIAAKRPKSYTGYTISDISVSKIITDKRAQAYNEKPIRNIEGSDDKTAAYGDIVKEGDADREMQFFDVVSNLNRYCLLWINHLSKSDKYQWMTLHPYEFVLVRDKDTGELLIVGLNYPDTEITQNARSGVREPGLSGDNSDGISDLISESQTDGAAESKTWVFWSAKQHVKVSQTLKPQIVGGVEVLKPSIDYIPIPDNPSNVNPLGILPFIYDSVDTSVDYPTVNPLTSQSITYNAQQSETLTSKNVHGSGIQVFKYPERMAGRFQKMSHGQLSAVELPQSSKEGDAPSEFEYKASGAQLDGMMASDMQYLEQIFKEHGIDNFSMNQGGVDIQSGVSKAVAGANVQRIIERNQQRYKRVEQKAFDIVKAWENLLGRRTFDQNDELEIVYPRPKVMVSDDQTLTNIEKMLDLGLIEEWEKFQKMDPNLSEEKAKEKLERVEAERQQRARGFLGADNSERINEESEPRLERPEQRV